MQRKRQRASIKASLWCSLLLYMVGTVAYAAEISFNPSTLELSTGETAVVQVVVSDIEAPGLAAFDLDINFDPALVNIENPNEGTPLNAFVPLGNDPFCNFVGRCDDPDWFLTSTGRTAQAFPNSIDNVNGEVMFGYGTQQGNATPTGSGVIGLIVVEGVGGGDIATEITIGADSLLGTGEDPPQRIPFTTSPLIIQAPGNDPVFPDPQPDLVMREGQTLTVNFRATDEDGDGVAFTEDPASPLPPFASLTEVGGNAGQIQFTPNFSDAGNYTIVILGTDDSADNRQARLQFGLTVINETVTVPGVIGQTRAAAEGLIGDAGLTVGTVTEEFNAAPAGTVIGQSPAGGSNVDPGTPVNLVVSRGPAPVNVPDVVGNSQAVAQQTIIDATLSVGTISEEFSDTVAAGNVISQNPVGGTSVPPGTAVDLLISLGPQPTVPDVIGQQQAAAEAAIVAANLAVGTVTEQFTDTFAAGSVLEQSPVGGTRANPGTAVDLVVSLGPRPTVPDVVGFEEAEAIDAIVAADLVVGNVARQFADTIPEGEVISQTPEGGTRLDPGSAVNLVISLGPEPVAVPNVVGSAQVDAEQAITNATLSVGNITEAFSDVVPAGDVISQTPIAGTEVLPGTAVDLVVSLGPQPTVPDVVGLDQTAAENAIVAADLAVGTITEEFSDSVPSGSVISQSPVGGERVDPETAVNLVVSLGPEPVEVPNVVGENGEDAEGIIIAAQLMVGEVTTEFSDTVPAGEVISQSPAGGELALPGSAVDFVVSLGPQPVPVPNVIGATQANAEALIVAAELSVGNVTTEFSDTVPAGNVIGQNPIGGTEVLPGTAVDLVISLGPQPVPVPNVVGQTQAAAETNIVAATLSVGAVTTEFSDTVPASSVISQNPTAGTEVLPGTAVDLVVSLGPEPVPVPNVIGLSQGAAESAILEAELTVGAVTTQFSDSVPAGDVISQDPAGGTTALPGSPVSIVVSLGPEPVPVPDVVGLPQATAQQQIIDADLVVGNVSTAFSDTVPDGSVISQNPTGGTEVLPGSAVDLVISSGVEPVEVPNVVGLSQADAEAAIGLVELNVNVSTQFSDTVPEGNVISQSPAGGSQVPPGTDVNIVVSLGPEPVAVPDVVGLAQAAAEVAITNAELVVGVVSTQFSDSVAESSVISQNPTGGTEVLPGTAVDLVISLGPEPIPVPDVVGQAQAAAETAITNAGLAVGNVTTQFSDTAAEGTVISQNPSGGTEVLPGTAVDLVISLGPEPVAVPDVVGNTQAVAEAAIVAAELAVGAVTTEFSDTVPEGNVISQTPVGGTEVLPGTAVNLVISLGQEPVSVPNVVGETQAAAESAILEATLTVGTISAEFSDTVPEGTVISQTPVGGTEVLPGTAVDLVISSGQEPVAVPDVVGQTQTAAEAAIVNAELAVGAVTTQFSDTVPEGSVISQNPTAGTEVLPGSAVDLVVSLGQEPVAVPDVVGQAQAAAEAAITGATLAVGNVTTQFSDTVPEGAVISQNPTGGTEVLPGTAVDLVVSLGQEPVAVPDVVGQAQAAAEAAIAGANLAVGNVTTEFSDTVPEGTVISQNPIGGTEVLPGTAVDLVISLGQEPVAVPDVVGKAQAAAEAAITGASLTVGNVTTEFSDTAPEGTVISQNPTGGTEVLPGTAVDLVISLGQEPVAVPDVVGQAQATAEAAITGANLAVGNVTTEFSDTVPEGDVISQNPTAGTEVLPGTAVDLVVSLGVQPVGVPDVVGQAQADAEATIVAAEFTVGEVTEEFSDTAPAGTVISQSPAGGTEALPGTAIALVISAGPEPVVVPNVVGQLQADAEGAIVAAELIVGDVTIEFSDSVPEGQVISQTPEGGAEVAPGSAVNLVVSAGVEPVVVPDVIGLPQADAEAALVDDGLAVGEVSQVESDTVPKGAVISQSPEAGNEVAPGTAVDLVVSLGSAPVAVGAADPETITLGESTTLNGSDSSDADGDDLTYEWGIVSTPLDSTLVDGDITGANNPAATVVPDVVGQFEFQLLVSDGDLEDTTVVMVNVLDVPKPPVADAGDDQTVNEGDTVNLDGTGSNDPENIGFETSWTFLQVPAGSDVSDGDLTGATTLTPSFAPDVAGDYVLQLTVSNVNGDSSDTVTISVIELPNELPVADAGADSLALLGEPATLDGSGSSDPDIQPLPLAYSWTFVSVPAGSILTDADIADATLAIASFIPDVAGQYVARLDVEDGKDSDFDQVMILAGEAPAQPVATAGRAKGQKVTITWPAVDGADNYVFYRRLPGEVDFTPLFTTDSPIGIDLIPAGVTSAEYQVVAVNIFGESPASEPVTARPAQRIRRR